MFSDLHQRQPARQTDPATTEVEKESISIASDSRTSSIYEIYESDSKHPRDIKLFRRTAKKPSGLPTDAGVLLRVLAKLRKVRASSILRNNVMENASTTLLNAISSCVYGCLGYIHS